MMSNYTNPAPTFIGREIVTREAPGAHPVRQAHTTTIVDASNPQMGGITFQASDGISYRWEDEGAAWRWVEDTNPSNPALNKRM